MKHAFDMAIGTATGIEHSRVGLNCQDSYSTSRADDYVCGVVSDGCSGIPEVLGAGSSRTEVGAAMLSRLAANVIPQFLSKCLPPDRMLVETCLEFARVKMLESLSYYSSSLAEDGGMVGTRASAEEAGGLMWPSCDREMVLAMYFAATIVGFYASDSLFTVFSLGDGFYSVNGNLKQLDTADSENNAPAYLAYGLIGDIGGIPPEALRFRANFVSKPEDVERAMVATDGIRFMIGKDETQVPGKTSKIGSIAQLWDDKVFVNKDMLRRKLSLLNKDVHVPDWAGQAMVVHSAILKDDVAVMSVRRRP